MNKIGIYGGSFNPVHFGHLNLALEMLEKRNLSKIYFCPTNISPFKLNSTSVAPHHRLKMLELALEGIPEFSILENELCRPGPSYSVDTIEELLKNEIHSDSHYYLIIGEDSLARFHQWYRVKDIIQLTTLIVGVRSSSKPNTCEDAEIKAAILTGLTPTKTFDISSSEIRERIRRGKYCSHLLPLKVLDYIYANRLYFDT